MTNPGRHSKKKLDIDLGSNRGRCCGTFLAMILAAGLAMAGEQETASPGKPDSDPLAPASPSPPQGGWSWLISSLRWDARHAMVSEGLISAVDRIDHLFGDARLDDDSKQTWVRVRIGLQYSKQDDVGLLGNVRLRLALPQLENRLHVILDRDTEGDDASTVIGLRDRREQPVDAGLRYILRDDGRHRFSMDGGVRGSSPVQLYGRVRGRLVFPFSKWELRLSETLSWLTSDGLVDTVEMRWTRLLKDGWWFRSISSVTWAEARSGVMPAQTFLAGRELSDRRVYRLEISGEWPEIPHARSAKYMTEFTYRHRLYKNWWFMEIAPGIDFRQDRNFQANPGISFRCEVIVGEW